MDIKPPLRANENSSTHDANKKEQKQQRQTKKKLRICEQVTNMFHNHRSSAMKYKLKNPVETSRIVCVFFTCAVQYTSRQILLLKYFDFKSSEFAIFGPVAPI